MVNVVPFPEHRDFDAVRRELEDVTKRLRDARDPEQRHDLLLKLRMLLREADAINKRDTLLQK